jgi:hypothetical protein
MAQIEIYKGTERAVSLRPANPDGKGLNGFLLDWYLSEPRGVVAKPHRQVLAEFFTSMLVLSARFKYKPAVGTENYLYLNGDDWELSLIAPREWTAERQAGFVGTCILQGDMTWTIEPSDNLKTSDSRVADAVSRFYDAFRDTLDADLTLEEILPFYVGRMPYYQRLYANALSRSIRAAVILGGQAGTRSREWLCALPRTSALLENRQS